MNPITSSLCLRRQKQSCSRSVCWEFNHFSQEKNVGAIPQLSAKATGSCASAYNNLLKGALMCTEEQSRKQKLDKYMHFWHWPLKNKTRANCSIPPNTKHIAWALYNVERVQYWFDFNDYRDYTPHGKMHSCRCQIKVAGGKFVNWLKML